MSGKHALFSHFKYVFKLCLLKGLFCSRRVISCSSESLQKWVDDAGETTADLDQGAADIDSWFDKDILKTIKVTIHQHTPTGETHRDDEEEKVEVCGSAFKFRFRDQFHCSQLVACSFHVHVTCFLT